jgi:hypothetical protein
MALKMDQLKRLLEAQDLRYFLDPRRDAIMLGASGIFGKYQSVILLEDEGKFLQFRSVAYLHCQASNPNLFSVLKVLGQINYQMRGIKFGWDPNDGEIAVYSDIWIQDGTLTQEQFARMLHVFFSGIDMNLIRIGQTIETGEDPGEVNPVELLDKAGEHGSSLPSALKVLLDKLLGRSKPDDDDKRI